MRSIKRNRQIEDLVFDKLQKRGFIENGEENANFIKNLPLGMVLIIIIYVLCNAN